jgi:hypothetical protein
MTAHHGAKIVTTEKDPASTDPAIANPADVAARTAGAENFKAAITTSTIAETPHHVTKKPHQNTVSA